MVLIYFKIMRHSRIKTTKEEMHLEFLCVSCVEEEPLIKHDIYKIINERRQCRLEDSYPMLSPLKLHMGGYPADSD